MRYIDALEMLNTCVELEILHKEGDCIFVYRDASSTSPEGWYLSPINDVAQELMHDEEGIAILSQEIDLAKNKL